MIGTSIGTYRITAKLGAGGMGEVYRATDTKLKRDVALKVLPEAFARDPERLARFEREAEVLASLNHPNIASIYGVVEDRALVMELVEGSEPKGPLPFDEAWAIMSQVAAALDYAHEKGVVHRDLKPANIKVTPDGIVKLLDFGLAKAFSNQPDAKANPENSPTLTIGATLAGVILGTAAYMSPEQAKGKSVDKRADIWAFGVVLYELLTGERLFKGEDVSETLAQVLTKEPDLNNVPARARRLLRRCLEKDPKKRLRDVGEAGYLILPGDPVIPTRTVATTKRWIWPSVAAVFAAISLVLGFISLRHMREAQPQVLRMSVLPPDKATFKSTSLPALSPDGRRLAFVATLDGKDQLWVRDLDSLTARALIGTDGAEDPFWSPDSRSIGFFADGKLKKMEVAGGPAQTLCDAGINGLGGSWNQNNVIVFASTGAAPILRVSSAGGDTTPLTRPDRAAGEAYHRFPSFLPDGRHFLYTAVNGDSEKTAIYLGDLESRDRKRIVRADSEAIYSPPGYLLFVRERTLMAQSFDVGKLQTTGDPVPIAERVDAGNTTAHQEFSASQEGALVYMSGGTTAKVQFTWFDRSGKQVGTVGLPGKVNWAAISSDGKTVATDRLDIQTNSYDIWLHDFARGTESRFTFGPKTNNLFPVWSPDGSHIAFYSARQGLGHAFQKAVAGVGQDEVLDQPLGDPPRATRVEDWSRDGRYLIEGVIGGAKSRGDTWVLPLFGDRRPYPYLNTEFNEQYAKLSPSGRWLAYTSDESKRNEIYVQTFPKPGGKWQVSTNGGERSVWSRDGKELYFLSADGKMMAVDVKGSGTKFVAGVPKALFDVRFSGGNAWFDVSPDGRFLIPVQAEQSANAPMTVLVNWTAALKR